MSRFALIVAFFTAIIGSKVVAEPIYQTWGHIQNDGFTWIGKPDVIRADCLNWMAAHRIAYSSSIYVHHTAISLPANTPAQTLCEVAFQNATSLGSSEKQKFVGGEFNGKQFFYATKPSTMITACKQQIARGTNPIVRTPMIDGVPNLGQAYFYGDEFCGEIADRSVLLDHPYDLHLVSGTIMNHGFAFYGNPEKILDSCRSFIAKYAITSVMQFDLSSGRVVLPARAEGERICAQVFRRATFIADSRRVFTFAGEINHKDVWFLGKPDKIFQACIDWSVAARVGRIVSVTKTDGTVIRVPSNLLDEGVCGLIFASSAAWQGTVHWRIVHGSVQTHPFLWTGPVEVVAQQCLSLFSRFGIRTVSDVEIAGQRQSLGAARVPMEACRQIIDHATVLDPPHDIFEAQGSMNQEAFWFRGPVEEFVRQCLQFSLDRRLVNVSSLIAYGNPLVDNQSITVEDACYRLTAASHMVLEQNFAFFSGQLKDIGFAFVGRKSDMQNECVAYLGLLGITSGDKFIVHDQEFLRDTSWTSAASLCDEFSKKGLTYEVLPSVSAQGNIGGRPFSFQGRLDEAMLQCLSFIASNNILTSNQAVVNGSPIVPVAPQTQWFDQQVCGVVLKAVLP